jgi:hypothetical protein
MTHPAARFVAGTLLYGILFVAVGFVGFHAAGNAGSTLGLLVMTIAFGAAWNRWPAALAPVAMVAIFAPVAILTRAGCDDCEDPAFSIVVLAVIYAVPAAAAIALGVWGRRRVGKRRRPTTTG